VTSSRLYPERPFLAASVAVLRGDKVLLAARAHPPAAHVFSLPGGVVEPGETLAEAALRELREEVGIEATMLGFIAPIEVIERDEAGAVRRHFVVCAHAALWRSGEPSVGPEALELLWVGRDDLSALDTAAGPATTPGLVPILEQAFAMASE
jgi:ADP-ribose pyrophosphatase YjhB (NUDIX family)